MQPDLPETNPVTKVLAHRSQDGWVRPVSCMLFNCLLQEKKAIICSYVFTLQANTLLGQDILQFHCLETYQDLLSDFWQHDAMRLFGCAAPEPSKSRLHQTGLQAGLALFGGARDCCWTQSLTRLSRVGYRYTTVSFRGGLASKNWAVLTSQTIPGQCEFSLGQNEYKQQVLTCQSINKDYDAYFLYNVGSSSHHTA